MGSFATSATTPTSAPGTTAPPSKRSRPPPGQSCLAYVSNTLFLWLPEHALVFRHRSATRTLSTRVEVRGRHILELQDVPAADADDRLWRPGDGRRHQPAHRRQRRAVAGGHRRGAEDSGVADELRAARHLFGRRDRVHLRCSENSRRGERELRHPCGVLLREREHREVVAVRRQRRHPASFRVHAV